MHLFLSGAEMQPERIRAACTVADRALAALLPDIPPGVTERDLALRLEWLMRTGGAEALAFDVACPSGLEAALHRKAPDREYRRKLDGAQEARLIAVACSAPPVGRRRWTLRLLAEQVVELGVVDAVSHETVRRVLKQTTSSRG